MSTQSPQASSKKKQPVWVWILIGLGVAYAGYVAFSFARGFKKGRNQVLEHQQRCLDHCLPKCDNAKKADSRTRCAEACENQCEP
ncbi:MAG: hypothetical protein AAFU79_31700 [Myxococcota bacterium]